MKLNNFQSNSNTRNGIIVYNTYMLPLHIVCIILCMMHIPAEEFNRANKYFEFFQC